MSELCLFCCVPGCRRSWKDDGTYSEMICGRHWKMASATLRNRSKKLRAAMRKLNRMPDYRHTQADVLRYRRLHALHEAVWQRIKAAAVGTKEKPSGIDAILDDIGVR